MLPYPLFSGGSTKETYKDMSNQENYTKMDGAKTYPNGQASKLKKMTTLTYVLLPIGIVCLLISALLVGANAYVSADQLESTELLNQYRLASKTLTTAAQSYSILGEEEYLDKYNKELLEDQNREKAIEGLKENFISDAEWAQIDKATAMSAALAELEKEAFAYVEKGKLSDAQKIMYGEEYLTQMEQISTLTDEMIEAVQSRMGKQQNILVYMMLAFEGLFIIIFAQLVFRMLRTTKFANKELLVPIVEVSEQMEALANGDFLKKLNLEETESEVGTMVAAINFMKDNFVRMINEISEALAEMSEGNYQIEIVEEYVGDFVAIKETLLLIIEDTKKMLTTVVEASEEIEDGADRLAEAAVNLADGSTMQAQQITEIVELIGAVTKDMEADVAGAKETVQIATEAGEALSVSNAKMAELKAAIGEIKHKGEEIHEVITSLKDIANETNVLSLDAAIEASRTGESGRGFVAVAEQIKNLSEVSAEACERTLEMIVNTVQAVNKCVEIADVTSVNMEEVMEGARMATEQMSAIADGLVMEEARMQNINVLVDEIAQVVDTNSSTSEETAAISEVQASKAQTMVQLMHNFKI